MPFLLFNCARSTSGMRKFHVPQAIRRLPASIRKAIKSYDFKFELIDPYHVAGLISVAQTQMAVLQSYDQPLPDTFKASPAISPLT